MKKYLELILIFSIIVGYWAVKVKEVHAAQNPSLTPSTLTLSSTISHTNCNISAGQTVYCFAGDGLWVSLNGAPFVQVATGTVTAGVTSITVNGGVPQTGPVALAIPSKATVVIPAQTVSGSLQ